MTTQTDPLAAKKKLFPFDPNDRWQGICQCGVTLIRDFMRLTPGGHYVDGNVLCGYCVYERAVEAEVEMQECETDNGIEAHLGAAD